MVKKLQQDVFDVLLLSKVILVADLTEMFSQATMVKQDRRYHRLLWRGLDLSRPPEVYEAMRLMFVYRSSPCLAQYVVQKHSEDNIYDYLLVVAIILIQMEEDKAIKARDQLRMIRLG